MRPTLTQLVPLILLAGCGAPAPVPVPAPAAPPPPSCADDLAISHENCGACGVACEEIQACIKGSCREDPRRTVQVALSSRFACAVRADGSVGCWGAVPWGSTSREPRIEPALARATQIAVLDSAACALRGDGTAVCVEALYQGSRDSRRWSLALPGGASVLAANGEYLCGLLRSGAPRCLSRWSSAGPQLLPLAVPTDLDVPGSTTALSLGAHSMCVLPTPRAAARASYFCWTWQMGISATSVPIEVPTEPFSFPADAVAVALGAEETCFLRSSGDVWCTGWWKSLPPLVDAPPDMPAEACRERACRLAGLADITSIAGSKSHLCALRRDGKVLCWGDDGQGQLGRGKGEPGKGVLEVAGIEHATGIATGADSSCAILRDGSVRCWGAIAATEGASFAATPVEVVIPKEPAPEVAAAPPSKPITPPPVQPASPPPAQPASPPPAQPAPALPKVTAPPPLPAALAARQTACDGGDNRACVALGEALYNGRGVDIDAPRAVPLFRKACDAGEPTGCVDLGWAFASGAGVARDGATAATQFGKACTATTALGCLGLGVLVRDGTGVPKDPARAAALFKQACAGGVVAACKM